MGAWEIPGTFLVLYEIVSFILIYQAFASFSRLFSKAVVALESIKLSYG